MPLLARHCKEKRLWVGNHQGCVCVSICLGVNVQPHTCVSYCFLSLENAHQYGVFLNAVLSGLNCPGYHHSLKGRGRGRGALRDLMPELLRAQVHARRCLVLGVLIDCWVVLHRGIAYHGRYPIKTGEFALCIMTRYIIRMGFIPNLEFPLRNTQKVIGNCGNSNCLCLYFVGLFTIWTYLPLLDVFTFWRTTWEFTFLVQEILKSNCKVLSAGKHFWSITSARFLEITLKCFSWRLHKPTQVTGDTDDSVITCYSLGSVTAWCSISQTQGNSSSSENWVSRVSWP